jgi:hypothetical protein
MAVSAQPDLPASWCTNCGKRIWIGHPTSLITGRPSLHWKWVHLGDESLPVVGCRAASYRPGNGWNESLVRWWKATPPVDEDELGPWIKAQSIVVPTPKPMPPTPSRALGDPLHLLLHGQGPTCDACLNLAAEALGRVVGYRFVEIRTRR